MFVHLFLFTHLSLSLSQVSASMANHYPSSSLNSHLPRPTVTTITTTHTSTPPSFLRKLQHHVSVSTQLFGILTLFITVAILLLLTGITVTGAVLGLILFSPLIILLSPIWVPPCIVIFLAIAGFLSTCGFGVVLVASFTWVYRYLKRPRKPGSNRVEYALNRLNRFNDSPSFSKDYARENEYGGTGRVKYAAPEV